MSLAAFKWATALPGVTHAQRRVALVLADHHDPKTGDCCPSVTTIAGLTGLGARWVQRCLHQLEAGGHLSRDATGGRGRFTHYHLPVALVPAERAATAATHTNEKGWPVRSTKGGHSAPQRVAMAATGVVLEREEETRGTTSPSAAEPPPRPAADALREAVVAACGAPETKPEAIRHNVAVKDLREAGATPEEVARRAESYRRRWPTVSLTATALARHWGALGRPEPKPGGTHHGANGHARGAAIDVQNRLTAQLAAATAGAAAPRPPPALPVPRQEVG